MTSYAELLASEDKPFGGVILVPFDSISIVHWELVVEVVITFTNGNESGDEVITRCMLVVKWRLAEIVSK